MYKSYDASDNNQMKIVLWCYYIERYHSLLKEFQFLQRFEIELNTRMLFLKSKAYISHQFQIQLMVSVGQAHFFSFLCAVKLKSIFPICISVIHGDKIFFAIIE